MPHADVTSEGTRKRGAPRLGGEADEQGRSGARDGGTGLEMAQGAVGQPRPGPRDPATAAARGRA